MPKLLFVLLYFVLILIYNTMLAISHINMSFRAVLMVISDWLIDKAWGIQFPFFNQNQQHSIIFCKKNCGSDKFRQFFKTILCIIDTCTNALIFLLSLQRRYSCYFFSWVVLNASIVADLMVERTLKSYKSHMYLEHDRLLNLNAF